MFLSVDDIERAARHIADLRENCQPFGMPVGLGPVGRWDAYKIHARVRELIDPKHRDPGGYKVSGMQIKNPHPELPGPYFATIPQSMILQSGAEVSCSPHRKLGVECEIAVRIGLPHNELDGPLYVKSVLAVLELTEMRDAPLTSEGLPLLLADGIWNLGCVVGSEVAAWPDNILHSRATIARNGATEAQGVVGQNLGDPRHSLDEFVKNLPELGWPIAEDMIILTGNLCGEVYVDPGDSITSEIEGIGRIDVSFR